MEKYLTDLIERMLDRTDEILKPGYESAKTISWNAFREAENISNIDFIPQLILFLDKEKDKKKRDKAYFILGHIAKNTGDLMALAYLIGRINKETDKYILSALLDRIANIQKPRGTDLEPLIQATKNERWLIRHSAISAFRNSDDDAGQAALLEILDKSEDPYNLFYACTALSSMGTVSAIPHLLQHLKSRKRDVKNAAAHAIEEIEERCKK